MSDAGDVVTRLPDRQLDEALEATYQRWSRWIVATPHQHAVLTLLVGVGYITEALDLVPHVAIRSAEPESGKSKVLQGFQRLLGDRAAVAMSGSLPLLARRASRRGVVILLDETDRWISSRIGSESSEGLIGLVNAAFERGTEYARMAKGKGEQFVEEIHYPFAPFIMAGLRDLPDTIASRSIPIWLRRKRPDQKVEPMRARDSKVAAAPIVSMWEAWASEGIERVREFPPPPMPAGLSDRQMDISEPLLVLADMAGGRWPGFARAALISTFSEANLVGRQTLGSALLVALRAIWLDAGDPDVMSSVTILERLAHLEDGPWAKRYGDPTFASDRQKGASRLAADLRPFEVAPQTIRLIDGTTPKGYRRIDLEEPWAIYADAVAPVADVAASSEEPPTPAATETLWEVEA